MIRKNILFISNMLCKQYISANENFKKLYDLLINKNQFYNDTAIKTMMTFNL